MENSDDVSILRKKMHDRAAAPGDVTRPILRALRLAMARVSRDRLGLRIDTIGGTHDVQPPEALVPVLRDDHLLLFLEGEAGISGAVALGPDLVRALVQQQTIGMLLPSEGAAREFTDTDAALCAPVVEEVLKRAAALSGLAEDRDALSGHGFGARAQDGQSMALALDGEQFRAVELTLDIGAGTAQSRLAVILPDATPAEVAAEETATGRRTLGDAALGASVRLNAIMCRMPVALGELARMQPGDVLPLPAYRLDRTELLTVSGQSIGVGRLGRVDGLRAVRVNETSIPDPDFIEPQAPEPDTVELTLTPEPAEEPPRKPEPEAEDVALDLMDQEAALKHISELAGLGQDDLSADDQPGK